MACKGNNVSLKMIAERCGVSPTLVSAALRGGNGRNRCSEETRRQIAACAHELGYTPNLLARAVVTGKTPVVLLSLHDHAACASDEIDFYFSDLLIEASRTLARAGLYMLFIPHCDFEEQQRQLRETVDSGLVSGVLSNLIGEHAEELQDSLAARAIPYVLLGFPDPLKSVAVGVDPLSGARYADDYAREIGFRGALGLGFLSEEKSSRPGNVTTREPIHPGELDDDSQLLCVSGIACYRQLLRMLSGRQRDRLVLLEDIRFNPEGIPHALLFESAWPRMMRKACELLADQHRSGTIFAPQQYQIERNMENVKVIRHN